MIPRHQRLRDEPFTLGLSAGFFGFYAHTGFLLALEDYDVRPRRVVGVSAGALAGGLWAGGTPAAELEARLRGLRRSDFWDVGLPLGGLIAGRKFARLLDGLTRVEHIESSPLEFAAVAYDLLKRRAVLLQQGPIGSAIRASCAVPGMFRPVWHNRRLFVDGGVTDRVGWAALDQTEHTVFHWLPSSHRDGAADVREREALSAPRAWRILEARGLPRVTPFHLDRGPVALEKSRDATRRWLDQKVME